MTFYSNVSRKLENMMISLQYDTFSFLSSKHYLYIKKTSGYIAFFISELAKRENFTPKQCVLSNKYSTNIDFILIKEANWTASHQKPRTKSDRRSPCTFRCQIFEYTTLYLHIVYKELVKLVYLGAKRFSYVHSVVLYPQQLLNIAISFVQIIGVSDRTSSKAIR